MINVRILLNEIIAAGISAIVCQSNGVVVDADGNEIHERDDVREIITAHEANYENYPKDIL